MLTMGSRVGGCLLAEKQGLCSESLSHAMATASHDYIFDIDGITVFPESKDTSIDYRANGDWKYSPQVDSHYIYTYAS